MLKIKCPNCNSVYEIEEIKKNHFCRECGKYLLLKYVFNPDCEEINKLPKVNGTLGLNSDFEVAYSKIKRLILDPKLIDSLAVAWKVEEYRQFWKPKEVKVVLLAESHVYTPFEEYQSKLNSSLLKKLDLNESYPNDFVRFVYCLGYGENSLLSRRLVSNKGTYQFWKIFCNCVGEDEARVQKVTNSFFQNRLGSKIDVLRKMQQRGVWLLDASIVGLYRSAIKEDLRLMSDILRTSWKSYVEKVLLDSAPKHVVVIGSAVEKAIKQNLGGFDYTFIKAPQAHERHDYGLYGRICDRFT